MCSLIFKVDDKKFNLNTAKEWSFRGKSSGKTFALFFVVHIRSAIGFFLSVLETGLLGSCMFIGLFLISTLVFGVSHKRWFHFNFFHSSLSSAAKPITRTSSIGHMSRERQGKTCYITSAETDLIRRYSFRSKLVTGYEITHRATKTTT